MRCCAARQAIATAGPAADAEGALVVGDVILDPDEHEVIVRGETISLPLKEFELLHLLLANAGRVLPRETLIDRVWGTDYVGDTKTLDVHVKRLRAKVEADPANPVRIVTIRGLGYKYERPRGQASGTMTSSGHSFAFRGRAASHGAISEGLSCAPLTSVVWFIHAGYRAVLAVLGAGGLVVDVDLGATESCGGRRAVGGSRWHRRGGPAAAVQRFCLLWGRRLRVRGAVAGVG